MIEGTAAGSTYSHYKTGVNPCGAGCEAFDCTHETRDYVNVVARACASIVRVISWCDLVQAPGARAHMGPVAGMQVPRSGGPREVHFFLPLACNTCCTSVTPSRAPGRPSSWSTIHSSIHNESNPRGMVSFPHPRNAPPSRVHNALTLLPTVADHERGVV